MLDWKELVDLRRDARPTGNQRNMIMLIRLPRIFRDGPLELQPLLGLHIMQVLAHRSIGIPLNHKVNIPFRVLIARRRIRPDDRLVHLGALILSQERRRNRKARDVIAVWEGEAEFFRVVVDLLDGFELQVDETLVSASEGLLRRRG